MWGIDHKQALIIGIASGIVLVLLIIAVQAQSIKSNSAIMLKIPDVQDGQSEPESFFSVESPFAFRYYMETVESVPGWHNEEANPLPDSLIIPTGHYSFNGKTFNLQKEGLYRFLHLPYENQQRIVYEGKDVDALLSAIAWIYSHGNVHDNYTMEELTNKALTTKVYSTCGVISEWLVHTLASRGVESRIVQTLTLDSWNEYDNGHTLIEVYNDKYSKWVLYDLDNNGYFVHSGIALSLLEFSELYEAGDYKILRLARDIKLDISRFTDPESGYRYSFYAETVFATEDTQKEWYKRVMQIQMLGKPITGGNGNKIVLYHSDAENREWMEINYPSAVYMERAEFLKTFY